MFELHGDQFFLVLEKSSVVGIAYNRKEAIALASGLTDPKILLAQTSEIAIYGGIERIPA